MVTRSLNNQNRTVAASNNMSSGMLGVYPNRKGWMARIHVNGKDHHLGTFQSTAEAQRAYLEAKKRLHPNAP